MSSKLQLDVRNLSQSGEAPSSERFTLTR